MGDSPGPKNMKNLCGKNENLREMQLENDAVLKSQSPKIKITKVNLAKKPVTTRIA